ncbi:high mobility group box domain-containing protein [Protomyces lactucae-debilis]|uniref:High mobility group box domain-containing protein n=1 Tax=Protomyces lactucae-debilis TaxID=2754530 RepID=A0A1Y2ESM6_PROLT|nr:high mobility group box domain-containing protein [Protomyces lactucae-debilis]ORY74578.1 high mobility group box domain-containing protein [Protomyces lactucae-debilis]
MPLGSIEHFSMAEALSMINHSEGWACFIPNGFLPVLVAEEDFAEEVCDGMRRLSSYLVMPTSLEDCRLPSLVVTGITQGLEHPIPAGKPRPPRRPANSFILYRKAKQAELIALYPGISNNEVSRSLGQMWKKEDEQTKQFYQSLAEGLKTQHKALYPDYKYCPKRPKVKNDFQTGTSSPSSCSCTNAGRAASDRQFR